MIKIYILSFILSINVLAFFFFAKKPNVRGCFFLIHRWDLDLIFRLGFRQKNQPKPKTIDGLVAEPFQAPPSGKDTFAPSDPAAGEVGKMEKWKPVTVTWPRFW